MKILTAISVSLFFSFLVYGFSPPPAWHRVEGNTIGFFKENGFEFSVDDSMAHHYEKPTLEISILIPGRFIDSGLTNTFNSVLFSSDEISTSLGTHEFEGKKRVILTISEAMVRKSEVVFYFRNERKGVTHGSMYQLELAKIVDDWRMKKP